MLLLLITLTLTCSIASSPEQLQSLTISLAPLLEMYKTQPAETVDLAAALQKKFEDKKKRDLEAAQEAEAQQKQEEEAEKKQKEANNRLRNMPFSDIVKKIMLYPQASALLKFLDPVLPTEQTTIIQAAREKAKQEVKELTELVDQTIAKQVQTPLEQALDKDAAAFETFYAKLKNPDASYNQTAAQITALQKLLSEPPQDNKLFFESLNTIKSKLDNALKTITKLPLKPLELIAKNQIITLISKIEESVEKNFKNPTDSAAFLTLKKQKLITSNRAQEAVRTIIPKLEEILQKYALSNNPTAKNYTLSKEFTNYTHLQEFIDAAAALPEIEPLIKKLKNSKLISQLKNIRDTDIKRLEELYAYFILEQNKLKATSGSQIILERIVQEIEKVKSSVGQKLTAITVIPEIPELKNIIANIKTQVLENYPPLESAIKKETELKAEAESAKDILNFLILFYLNPTGTLNQRLVSIMNTASKNKATSSFSKNLDQYGVGPLKPQYQQWQEKLNALTQAAKFPNVLHADYLSDFKDSDKLKEIKRVNKLIIENYNIATQKFKKNIQKDLSAQKEKMGIYADLLGINAWQDKLKEQFG